MAIVVADEVRVRRANDVENALGTSRLKGMAPSDEAMAIFQRYADGEISLEEMGKAIEILSDLKYGPVRLPGHVGP